MGNMTEALATETETQDLRQLRHSLSVYMDCYPKGSNYDGQALMAATVFENACRFLQHAQPYATLINHVQNLGNALILDDRQRLNDTLDFLTHTLDPDNTEHRKE